MPYDIVKGSGARPWKIKKKSGKIVGTSKSKTVAQASVRARMANE